MLLSEGQMSDYKGAALMLPAMPKAGELLADKGYDADWFRAALAISVGRNGCRHGHFQAGRRDGAALSI
jgi:transposase